MVVLQLEHRLMGGDGRRRQQSRIVRTESVIHHTTLSHILAHTCNEVVAIVAHLAERHVVGA